MSCAKEQLDEAGNPIRVADLTFVDGIVGAGSYGTVRLARMQRSFTTSSSSATPSSDAAAAASSSPAPPAASNSFQTPQNIGRSSVSSSSRTLNRVGSAGFPRGGGGTSTNGAPGAASASLAVGGGAGDPRRLRRDGGGRSRSNSAPAGHEFFQTTPAGSSSDPRDECGGNSSPPFSPIVQQAQSRFNSIFRADSGLGSGSGSGRRISWNRKSSVNSDNNSDDEEQDQLVAVKIFRKSVLKRKRTMERDKETRRVLVKTALEKVEREIALMKKLAHPNLVIFYEAIDSPDSDMLYLVRDGGDDDEQFL